MADNGIRSQAHENSSVILFLYKNLAYANSTDSMLIGRAVDEIEGNCCGSGGLSALWRSGKRSNTSTGY